ncbi:hypothetical protein P175DRAFT_0519753 [Aspergillus ochraceoroseus IBT 24754]|uniref:NmrA-like domain-containing protein n=2 Tax=Aspergillus ochraceoroseus TaxID=138278 RepID=A0A2T5M5A0_9EURO|nr:uncharacterized protein P175DRAFT_0519753 [Aspergillus ochraceoroseus IBT 24754]KKK23152.1 hypothetical protein AOCH_002294 [Aspergillus ochraceoroseus]PTU23717.1 hypothetical protein P175DRAFT_0519753 [Aspergillus ochraceoroseus IBT 24754]
MSPHKLIVVIGATGNQGSSVVRTFLNLPNWNVRAVTRNPSSPAAQQLASFGADVVQADLADLDSLRVAFQGAHAVFVNTDFWGPYRSNPDPARRDGRGAFDVEVQHGRNAAIAAAGVASLERFVYSALGPMTRASKGKYSRSFHWDSKAAIVDFIEGQQPDLAKKTSLIYLGAYATNPLFTPAWNPESGKYRFQVPLTGEVEMGFIDAAESTGPFVQALIEAEAPGTKLLAYDSMFRIGQLAGLWSKVTGKPAELESVTPDFMHQQFGIPWEVLEGPRFIEEYGYMGGVGGYIVPSQLKARVNTKPFEQWLAEQDWDRILDSGRTELASMKVQK